MNANPPASREVSIPVGRVTLSGTLTLPAAPRGIVLFAHGSGSSRQSPRNRFVADVLVDAGVATLLFDLLTPAEDRRRETRFDIPLLTTRLTGATAWLATEPALAALPVGYFGASTGAAAALDAAAVAGSGVRAVVSRGGRPDLAGSDALARHLHEQLQRRLRDGLGARLAVGVAGAARGPGPRLRGVARAHRRRALAGA